MKKLFGSIIALILLGIYCHLIYVGLDVINCEVAKKCTPEAAVQFNEGMTQALLVIGGLISALVLSVLARSEPGDPITKQLFDLGEVSITAKLATAITWLYLMVWVVTGLWVFMKGLYYPKALPALTNLGQAWFGLAVASAYAYFGLKQAPPADDEPR